MLAVLWWPWAGYAWLTSVVDPEEGAVRLSMFVAMAAFLVAALAVPDAFGDDAFVFACAYGIVRVAHIWLFTIASRDDPGPSPVGHGACGPARRSASPCSLAASSTDGSQQGALWVVAIALDVGAPFLFWAEGWKLMPSHFAERLRADRHHRARGVDRRDRRRPNEIVDLGVVTAATLGVALSAALWWLYFDVIAWLAERRLSQAAPGGSRTSSRATPTR